MNALQLPPSVHRGSPLPPFLAPNAAFHHHPSATTNATTTTRAQSVGKRSPAAAAARLPTRCSHQPPPDLLAWATEREEVAPVVVTATSPDMR
jgi:hypothetical protein